MNDLMDTAHNAVGVAIAGMEIHFWPREARFPSVGAASQINS